MREDFWPRYGGGDQRVFGGRRGGFEGRGEEGEGEHEVAGREVGAGAGEVQVQGDVVGLEGR